MIRFFTSIAPYQIEKQYSAISTWVSLGICVHSVNTKKEIDYLENKFPFVKFHCVERNGLSLFGKPYIFINDIFSVAQTLLKVDDVFILCNSDIYLEPYFFDRKIFKLKPMEMLFVNRFNVPARDVSVGIDYDCGIDIFCVRVSALPMLDMGDFCLGVPFWDFWLPILAISKGYRISKLNFPLAIHVNHPENYSHANLQKSGIHYLTLLTACKDQFVQLRDRLVSAKNSIFFDEILVNEVIFPTIALLLRYVTVIQWDDANSATVSSTIALEAFKTNKHSGSIFLRPYEKIFHYSPINSMKVADVLAEDIALECVERGIYPLYSNFYSRMPNAFLQLPKHIQISILIRAFLPVIIAVDVFESLEIK